jgi:hypothetical protein
MNNKTFVQIRPDLINIFMHNPKGKENGFVKLSLRHLKKPFDGGIYQNFDLWRLYEAYDYEYKDGEMVETLGYPFVSKCGWECSVAISSLRDMCGGVHGYEHQKEFFAEADGKPIRLDTEADLWVDSFRFYQKSVFIRQPTLDEPICNHIQDYTFKDGIVELAQELEWLIECNIRFAYLTMLPIRRTHDNTETGEDITDRIMTDLSDKVYDIEKAGHTTDISPLANRKRGVRWAKIWGEKSGLTAEVRIKRYALPDTDTFFVHNNAEYNKLYFSYAGDDGKHNTEIGEKWNQTARFELYRV